MFSRKRGADSRPDHDGPREKKAFRGFKESCSCNIKVLVTAPVVGKILGKKGVTIKSLQEDNSVHIALSKYGNHYPGTDQRVCLISGNTAEGVAKALDFIVEKLYQDFEGRPNEEKKIKLVMSNSTVGMVLGKGGSEIKKLKETSGVNWLAFASKDESPVPYERVFSAVGGESGVSTAFHHIMEVVNKDRNNGNNLEIEYDTASSMESADRIPPRGGEFNGGRAEFGGGGGRDGRPPAHSVPIFNSRDTGPRGGTDMRDVFGHSDADYNRARPPVFSNSNPITSSGVGGLLGLLGLDMKVNIPDRGVGKPLTSAVIMQLLEHVDEKLLRTSYTPAEFKDIKTSIANLASLGLLSLGLVDEKSNGFDGGAGGRDSRGGGGGGGYSSLYSPDHSYRRDSYRRD